MAVNLFFIDGTIGRAGEIRETKGGHKTTSCMIMNTKIRKEQQKTSWIKVVAWGKTAEILSGYQKGDYILVKGEYEQNEFKDKDGKKQYDTHITASLVFGNKSARPDNAADLFDGIPEEL